MKKLIVSLLLALSLTLGLASCQTKTPASDGLSELSGCYVLESAEYYVEDEMRESYSGDGELLVFKLREDGIYLIKFDGNSDSGNATLDDGTLTLEGELSPFAGLGQVISCEIEFGDAVIATVLLDADGKDARLTARLSRTGNYDDSFFDGGSDSDIPLSFIGVKGVKDEGYPIGGFSPDGIDLQFDQGGEVRFVPLTSTEFVYSDDLGSGYVEGVYMNCPFWFELKIISPEISFPEATATYTPQGVEHLPTLPEGYDFYPAGDTRFWDVGTYTVEGEVRRGDTFVSYVSSQLTITPLELTDYPTEISFRAEGVTTSVPEGTVEKPFVLEDGEYHIGECSARLYLDSANYVFEGGASYVIVTVRVLPTLVPVSEFEWVIPAEKIEYSYDWRDKMPYLAYHGERLEGVKYNYLDDRYTDMASGFVAGEYTVEADLSECLIEPDGDLAPCKVELSTRVLPLPTGGERAYTGYNVSAVLPDYYGEGIVWVSGVYLAESVGDYTYTLTVPDELFTSGAICFEGGLESATVEWSIVKAEITLTVNDSDFNRGFTFDYDGVQRFFSATVSPHAQAVIYVNDVRFEYLSDVVFRLPGTYRVRIEVESELYTAEPYETTVTINQLPLDLSTLGLTWQSGNFVYMRTPQEMKLVGGVLPYYVTPIYEGNCYADAGNYHATVRFKINEAYTDEAKIYYLTDENYTLSCDWSISPATLLKPYITDGKHYTYTGEEIVHYNPRLPEGCTVTGNTGESSGEYTLLVSLSKNYVFDDGTTSINIKWYIDGNKIDFGEIILRDSYSDWVKDTPFTPYIFNLDRVLQYYDYVLTGDSSATEPGEYSAKYTFTIKDEYKNDPNYVFTSSGEELGESFEFSYTYTIGKVWLAIPTVTGSYTYTGDDIIPTLSEIDTSLLEVVYPTARDAGEYLLTFKVKDSAHYCLSNDEGEAVSELQIAFTIGKATLTLSDFTSPIAVFDGVSYTPTLTYVGVGGESFTASFTLTEDTSTVSVIFGAGNYELTVTGAAGELWKKNYEAPTGKIFTFTVDRADIDTGALTWSHTEWLYDGNSGIPTLIGLPEGVDASMRLTAGYGGVNAYDGYEVTATLTSPNYNTATISTAFKVLPRPVALPTLADSEFVYTGEQYTITYTAIDPTFGSYNVSASGASATNAGEYFITFYLSDNLCFTVDGVSSHSISLPWSIAKADYDLSGISWSDTQGKQYPSDGTLYSFYLTGLPKGVDASYSLEGVQKIGDYEVVATLTNLNTLNYNDPVAVPECLTFRFSVVTATLGEWSYYVSNNGVYITAYSGSSAEVTLPEDFRGFSVVSIGSVFKGHSEIVYLDLSAMSFGNIDAGGLMGLDKLYELKLPRLADGRLLSDLFGGTTPSTLYALHAVGIVTQSLGRPASYFVKTLDCPSLKELYITTGGYIDFEDMPFDLNFMYFEAGGIECFLINFPWSTPLSIAHSGSAKLTFGVGAIFDTSYWMSLYWQQYTDNGVTVIDDNIYLLGSGSTAIFMGTRKSGNLVIPESVSYGGVTYTVNQVNSAALWSREDITSLTVPSTITSIGSGAFGRMTSLTEINWNAISAGGAGDIALHSFGTLNLGEDVVSLPDKFMMGSTGLREVVLPKGLTTIGEDCFNNCYNLIHLTLSESLTSVGSRAFSNTLKLADIYDPAGLATRVGGIPVHSYIVNPATLQNHMSHVYTDARDRAVSLGNDGFYRLTLDGIVYIVGYAGPSGDLTLPEGNGSSYYLPPYAFYSHDMIKSVTVSADTPRIPEYAFYGCNSLTRVVFSGDESEIGSYAFADCTSLGSIDLSKTSVSRVGNYAFSGCSSLVAISLPVSISYLGDGALMNCTALTSFTLPSRLTKLPNSLLRGCTSLESLTLGGGVTQLGNYCLYGCSALTELELLPGLVEIGQFALSGAGITELYIPSSVEKIGDYAFSNSAVEYVNIYCSITTLPAGIFADCASLTEVILPEGVVTIGSQAFGNCSSLVTVSMTNSVMYIEESAFSGCEKLVLTLPEALVRIEKLAFYGCTSLGCTSIPYTVKYIGTNAFENTGLEKPDELGLCIFDGWILVYGGYIDVVSLVIPDNVRGIASEAFKNTRLITVTVPEGVEIICDYAFENSNLTSISLPAGLLEIGIGAFESCEKLTEITIPDTVTSIQSSAFAYCTSLKDIRISGAVEEIGSQAFYGCTSLERITIGASVKTVNGHAFAGCTALSAVYYEGSLADWLNIVFNDQNANPLFNQADLYINNELLVNLIIPEGVTEIKNNAFSGCTSIRRVTVGNDVTAIGEYAFAHCYNICEVTIGGKVADIGDLAFYACERIATLDISDSVKIIRGGAFSGINMLVQLKIGSGLSTISGNAFSLGNGKQVLEIYNQSSFPSSLPNAKYYHDSLDDPSVIERVGDYLFATIDGKAYLVAYMGDDTEIVLPDDYKGGSYSIYSYAFAYNPYLTRVTLSDGVEAIEPYAFYGCTALESVFIPASVTTVGQEGVCPQTQATVYCEAESKPAGWDNNWCSNDVTVVWGYTPEE